MAGDIYICAGSVSADLADAGYEKWARRIDEVIVASRSTPQVVSGLRCTVGRLLDEEGNLPPALRARVVQLQETLDDAP